MYSLSGRFFLENGQFSETERLIKASLKFFPWVPGTHKDLGIALSLGKKCAEAEKEFKIYQKLSKDEIDPLHMLSINANECFEDKIKYKKYNDLYEKKKREKLPSMETF